MDNPGHMGSDDHALMDSSGLRNTPNSGHSVAVQYLHSWAKNDGEQLQQIFANSIGQQWKEMMDFRCILRCH